MKLGFLHFPTNYIANALETALNANIITNTPNPNTDFSSLNAERERRERIRL
jgi:hypothetical protein